MKEKKISKEHLDRFVSDGSDIRVVKKGKGKTLAQILEEQEKKAPQKTRRK